MKLVLFLFLNCLLQLLYAGNNLNPIYDIVFSKNIEVSTTEVPVNYLRLAFYPDDSLKIINKKTNGEAKINGFDLWYFRKSDTMYVYCPSSVNKFPVAYSPFAYKIAEGDSVFVRNLVIEDEGKQMKLTDISFCAIRPLILFPKIGNEIIKDEIYADRLHSLNMSSLQLYNYSDQETYPVKKFKLMFEIYTTVEQLHDLSGGIRCSFKRPVPIQTILMDSPDGNFTPEMREYIKKSKVSDVLRFTDIYYQTGSAVKKLGETWINVRE